jgi:hypothetical protein
MVVMGAGLTLGCAASAAADQETPCVTKGECELREQLRPDLNSPA